MAPCVTSDSPGVLKMASTQATPDGGPGCPTTVQLADDRGVGAGGGASRTPTETNTLRARQPEPRPLPDEVALELGDGGEDAQNVSAALEVIQVCVP